MFSTLQSPKSQAAGANDENGAFAFLGVEVVLNIWRSAANGIVSAETAARKHSSHAHTQAVRNLDQVTQVGNSDVFRVPSLAREEKTS